MKKLVSLLLGLSILVFVSCSDDDSTVTDPFTAMIGAWNLSQEITANCTDAANNDVGVVCTTGCPQFVVSADMTYQFLDGSTVVDSGTISNVTATSVTICETGATCGPLTYTLVGNTWTIVDPDDPDLPGCTVTIIFTKA